MENSDTHQIGEGRGGIGVGVGSEGTVKPRGVFEHVEFEMPISRSCVVTEWRVGCECGTWKGNKWLENYIWGS